MLLYYILSLTFQELFSEPCNNSGPLRGQCKNPIEECLPQDLQWPPKQIVPIQWFCQNPWYLDFPCRSYKDCYGSGKPGGACRCFPQWDWNEGRCKARYILFSNVILY